MDGTHYGAMQQRDESLSRSMVKEIVPEEHYDEFLKLISGKHPTDPEQMWSHRVGFLYNSAVIFAESRKWRSVPELKYSDIARMVNLVNYRDSITLFQNAPENIQTHVYMMQSRLSLNAINVYLRSVNRLGLRNLSYVGNDALLRRADYPSYGHIKATTDRTAKTVTNISKIIYYDTMNNPIRETFDLSKPKAVFRQQLMTRNLMLPAFGDLVVPIFVMWKAIYGQNVILDFMQKFSTNTNILTPDSLMDILDDWESLSVYPVEWIVETGDFNTIEY